MEDVLDDLFDPEDEWWTRKVRLFFLLYIPVCLLVYFCCSPIFLMIWDNKVGNQLPAGPFVLGLAVLLLFAGLVILKWIGSLRWKSIVLLLVEFLFVCVGMLGLFLLQRFYH